MNRTIYLLSHTKDPVAIQDWRERMTRQDCRIVPQSMATFWEFVFDLEDSPEQVWERFELASFWIDAVDPEQMPEVKRMVEELRNITPRPVVSVLVDQDDTLRLSRFADEYVLVHRHQMPIEDCVNHVVGSREALCV